MKKLLASLLALAMVLGLCACGGGSAASSAAAPASEPTEAASAPEQKPQEPEAPQGEASQAEEPASTEEEATASGGLITTDYTYDLPLVDDGWSFSMWVSFSDNMSTFMPNGFADNKAFQKAEELTGVHVDLREVTTTANSEQFSIAVASGDLPNVLTNVGQLWTSSFEQGIEDEILMDLTELTENYMPAYKECYDQLDDDTKRELHTDSGYMPKLITINNYPDGATEGAFIRTDYLEKVGMDIPTTYDELDKVLRAFQTELGLAEPLMATSGIVHTSNALCSGYDVNGGFSTFPMISEPYYVVDGQVKYGIVEPGFKEYMEMFSTSTTPAPTASPWAISTTAASAAPSC